MKITVYGSNICPGTLRFLQVLTENNVMPAFVNVTGSIGLLKEFITFRDTNPVYEKLRRSGKIGFPLIQYEDGTYTLDVNEALEKVGIKERINYR